MRWVNAAGNGVWMSAHIYRSLGPLIEVNVGSEESEEMKIYLRPYIVLQFAIGITVMCFRAFAFELRLILRDLWVRLGGRIWRYLPGDVWRSGHEHGWNDCLREWERREKLRLWRSKKAGDEVDDFNEDQMELPF